MIEGFFRFIVYVNLYLVGLSGFVNVVDPGHAAAPILDNIIAASLGMTFSALVVATCAAAVWTGGTFAYRAGRAVYNSYWKGR